MAEFSLEDFASEKPPAKAPPSKGNKKEFSLDDFGGTPVPSKSSSSIFGDKVSTQTLSDLVTGKEPPKTTGPGTFVREAVLSSPGTAAGVSAATAVGTATAPFGPWVAIPSAIVAGGAAGFAANYLEEEGLTALEESSPLAKKYMSMLNVDKATREAGRKEHEYYALGGQLASAAPFVSTKTAATVLSKSLVERGVSGTIQAGVGAGQRAATGEEQDLGKSLLEFGGGALMPGKLTKLGEKTVPSKFKPKEAPITPPPSGATPEQVEAFKAKVKEEKAKRDAAAPLTEAAIKNKKTGEIERMGPKHDEQRKAETADTHEQGFVDNRNNFHDREAAVDQAKRAGQIPEDHVLENPPGEQPGLHSGDLRKAGDERFKITEDQPAGKPLSSAVVLKDGSKISIETESSPNAFSTIGRMEHGEPISLIAKNESGEEIGRLTYMPDGGPIGVFVREQDRRKGVANALYDAHEAAGGKLPPVESGMIISNDARALRASREAKAAEAAKGEVKTPSSPDELAAKTSEPVAKAFEKVDPRSVPNEEEMIKHATDIHERFGEEEAVKFFEDYQKDLNERSIPVPNTPKELDDALHKVNTFESKDKSEHVVGYNKTSIGDLGERPSILNPIERNKWDKEAARRLEEMNKLREAAFLVRENGGKVGGELGKVLDAIDAENIALVRKIKAMGGDVGDEFATGQSRIRLFSEKEKPGWKETIKEFFSNKMSFGDKVAEQANAAIERKVFQTNDGRVIEFHRQPKDVTTPKGEIKQGTQIFEWKDGQKRLIGFSDDLNFKRGDTFTSTDGKKLTVVDGKVPAIEQHSPYRYWHDAEASARLANMGLRKMARELELVNNLKKSKLFETVGFSPDKPTKDLPKGWITPASIARIPELRGWHFDPKTAAIIEDFAKVWDNTMWMKATNAIVKNMMLNPVPHMFNEVMHLWNARGFTGWIDPRQLGTFADTARVAWRDVGNQTQFYRDIMREGGSILGADPRNKHFEAIQKEAQKQMFETPEMQRSMGQLAKKLGTSVGDLYNGISNASQKAMWFTRDVMYVQYIREIMARQEKSTGVKMELKDAIAQAEKHMPNYRMPSEVLNSRKLAWTLKNPNIALFSRYHYGMVKSLVNTIKDVDPRNLRTPEGRAHFREGVDSMLAIGVAMGVLYPLMDAMAEAVFGEGAEQRRAGPFHLLQAGLDVYEGKKDTTALIWPVFTFNPVLLTLGQLGFNKKLFTGKEVFHTDDAFEDIASDIGTYAVKQLPQAAPVMSATAEEGGDTKLIARQFDIKVETEAEKKRKERALKAKAQKKKTRDTQRAKGTYNP